MPVLDHYPKARWVRHSGLFRVMVLHEPCMRVCATYDGPEPALTDLCRSLFTFLLKPNKVWNLLFHTRDMHVKLGISRKQLRKQRETHAQTITRRQPCWLAIPMFHKILSRFNKKFSRRLQIAPFIQTRNSSGTNFGLYVRKFFDYRRSVRNGKFTATDLVGKWALLPLCLDHGPLPLPCWLFGIALAQND